MSIANITADISTTSEANIYRERDHFVSLTAVGPQTCLIVASRRTAASDLVLQRHPRDRSLQSCAAEAQRDRPHESSDRSLESCAAEAHEGEKANER